MELKEPRRKKRCKIEIPLPLPIIKISENTIHKFTGYFNDYSVIVKKDEDMKKLNSMGCFGKANLSRGYPLFNKQELQAQIIRKRIFSHRKAWGSKLSGNKKVKKVIVVPDSESETEDYFVNLKPEYQIDSSCIQEVLNLSLEEAFFLCNSIHCLDIYNNDALLDSKSTWELFCKTDRYFIYNYPVYYYFRMKNWVVKPGIKFGGDFLLYKEGPSFYHASYVVIIDVLDSKTLHRKDHACRRSMEVKNVLGLNRLCETVGKELLICQLLWPEELTNIQPEDIQQLLINEVVMRRWVSSQHRELLE